VRAAGRLEIELKSRMFEGDDGLVIVAAGINDSNPNNWLSGKQTPKKDLQAAIVKISEISKKYSCETIVLGLTPVNEKNCDKYFENNLVEKYNNYLKEVCTEREIKFIDVYEELKISDFIETLGDGVHPDDSGHEVLFDLIKTRIEI
jgi:lysophospholipase L1-like esterase